LKELIPVLVSGLTPFVILLLILTGAILGLVAWEPPVIWSYQFGASSSNASNAVTSISANGTAIYAMGGEASPYPSWAQLTKNG